LAETLMIRNNVQNPWPLPELAGLVELFLNIGQELVAEKLDGKFGKNVNGAVSLHVWTQMASFRLDIWSKLWLPVGQLRLFNMLFVSRGRSFVNFLEVGLDVRLESSQSGIRHVGMDPGLTLNVIWR
jgi:hypothetical protein